MIYFFMRNSALTLLFVIFILLSSCAEISKKEGGIFKASVETEDIPFEIKKLDENKNDTDIDVRIRSHLQLAALYSSYKNPNPNYSVALKELEKYVSLDPDGAKRDEIQNWLGVLREIEKIKHRTSQLMKENKELKDTMDKLKALDIKMEEKRKKVK